MYPAPTGAADRRDARPHGSVQATKSVAHR
jgi:hypothetical protein